MTTSYFFPDYPKLAIVLFRLELYASREKKIEFQNFWSSDIKTFKRETGVNVSTFLHEMA